jgi:hypothetical protein
MNAEVIDVGGEIILGESIPNAMSGTMPATFLSTLESCKRQS